MSVSRSEVFMCVVMEDLVRGFDSLRAGVGSPPIVVAIQARRKI